MDELELTIQELTVPGVKFMQQITRNKPRSQYDSQGAEDEQPSGSKEFVEKGEDKAADKEEEEENEEEENEEKENEEEEEESSDDDKGKWVSEKPTSLAGLLVIILYGKYSMGGPNS